MVSLEGSCHCGAIRFSVDLDEEERDVFECNCAICTKTGLLHLIVPTDRFTLQRSYYISSQPPQAKK